MPGTDTTTAMRLCLDQVASELRQVRTKEDGESEIHLANALERVYDLVFAVKWLDERETREVAAHLPPSLGAYVPPARRQPGARGGTT